MHYYTIKGNILHGICGTAKNHTSTGRIDYCYVAQRDVDVLGIVGHVALSERNVGPAETARISLANVNAVSLLCGSDPNRPLLRLVHDNVLPQHVLNETSAAELGVNALVRLVHVRVAEGDVAHSRATNRTDHETETARVNALEQHILGAVLDRDTIVLVPNGAVVNPHVLASHVETVGVESTEIAVNIPVN